MQWLKNKKFWAGAAVLLALGAAASHAHRLWQIDKAQTMSEELFKPEQPNPFCFGRLMIDLPKHAVVTGSLLQHPDAETIELTEGVSKVAFEKTVQNFEQQLRTTKHQSAPSLLKSVVSVDLPDTKVFVHLDVPYSDYPVAITGYRLLPNGQQYRFQSKVDDEFVQQATEGMVSVVKGLRTRAVNEVPTDHGFCIKGGFIADKQTGKWGERSELAIDLTSWSDLNISIESRTNYKKEDETLLDRVRTIPTRVPDLASAMHIIRSGSRDIGPHKGEEVLMELNDKGRKLYTFVWEVEGELERNDLPHITVTLRVGHRNDGKPMPTKDQMLALWEYVLAHLRVRPTTATQHSQAEPERAPLGELAATGRTCPQTGWWQCSEGGEVAGGKRQHFTAGQRMPRAVLLGEPSIWQKIKNERPSHKIATVWQLVDYDAVPVVAKAETATPPHTDAQSTPPDSEDAPPPSEG